MAHFAQLDDDNTVLQVVVVDNNHILDSNGQESESVGIEFCKSIFGPNTRWLQTSYNKSFRGMFAPVGGKYYPEHDRFVIRKPEGNHWQLTSEFKWEPNVPKPTDGREYVWSSTKLKWLYVPPGWQATPIVGWDPVNKVAIEPGTYKGPAYQPDGSPWPMPPGQEPPEE
jgi:hypothetical protein